MTERDYEDVLACIDRLYACGRLEQLPQCSLTEIPRLVGADRASFDYVAPSTPRVVGVAFPAIPHHARHQRIFSRYVADHPILKHYLATGDGSAHKISDFHSVRAYHALPLYRQFYQALRCEDQLAFELLPPGSELIIFSLARDRRSFTERDREILNLLRPHVARAYRTLGRMARLERDLRHGDDPRPEVRVTSLVLDAADRPRHSAAQAQAWIHRFFPERMCDPAHLPDAITEWLHRTPHGCHPKARGDAGSGPDHTLMRERDGHRLRMRRISGLCREGTILALELETPSEAVPASFGCGLTDRQIEVLHEVEQGKTNDEVATALGISPLTVRTHLEHIFETLRVPSRTAAVTQFRRRCPTGEL